ncbi:MAG: hypothetical protein C0P79_014085, partial [Gammaproteobacteria bacterium]
GETLGRIDDVILDAALDHARFLVVAAAKAPLGARKGRYAVPASRFRLDTENEALVADITADGLKNAPPLVEADEPADDGIYRLEES